MFQKFFLINNIRKQCQNRFHKNIHQILLTPSPPFWGGNPQYNVEVNWTNPQPVAKWKVHYYYDSLKNASRYEHFAPQFDSSCLIASPPSSIANHSCAAIFATDGWNYVNYWEDNWCCKCQNSYGSVRYDWLQDNSTFEGEVTINGQQTYRWLKYGQYNNNYYCTIDKELPVRFWEDSKGVLKQWDFLLDTYVAGEFNQSLIDPPANCTGLCKGYCSYIRTHNITLSEI